MPARQGGGRRQRRRVSAALVAAGLVGTGGAALATTWQDSGTSDLTGTAASVAATTTQSTQRPYRHHRGRTRPTPRPTTTTTTTAPTSTTAPSTTAPATSTSAPAPSTTTAAATGLPNADNTGAPSETGLKAVSGKGCSYVVSQPGAVVDAANVTGCIDVEASNVTIQNSVITSDTWWGIKYGATNRNITGLRVLHTTVQSVPGKGPDAGGYDYGISQQASGTMEIGFSDISGFKDGIDVSNGDVHDNYVHNLSEFSGAHTQSIYVWPGNSSAGVTLRHNTLVNQTSQQHSTASIYIAPDAGPQHNVTVTGNLLAGGAYAFYGGGTAASAISVTSNVFSTQVAPKSGFYGPVAYWQSGNGNVWSGNTWADGPSAGGTVPA
jgi:hypothetical protein